MRRVVILLVISSIAISACGRVRDSRINPFNWFGGSREAPAASEISRGEANPLIPSSERGLFSGRDGGEGDYLGVPVETVSNLVIERVPGGAIIRAEGVAQYQNVYEVQLTPVVENGTADESGVLEYRLEARIPASPVGGGSERVRTVSAARVVSDQDLENVRQIRVTARQNSRVSSRG